MCPQLLTLLTFSTWYSWIWCILIIFVYLRFVMGWIHTNWELIAGEAHGIWYDKPDSPKDPHSLDNWLQLRVHLGFSCRDIIETSAILFGCPVLRFLLAFSFLASPMGILRFFNNLFSKPTFLNKVWNFHVSCKILLEFGQMRHHRLKRCQWFHHSLQVWWQ